MLTQRQATLGILILQTLGAGVLLLGSIAAGQAGWLVVLVSLIIFAGLTAAYWRGYSWVSYINVILLTVSTGFGIQEPFLTGQFSPAILAVPVLILILADWRWMIGSAVLMLAILAFRAGGAGPYAAVGNLVIVATAIGGMVIARLITDTAQRRAEQAAGHAADAAREAEQNAAALSTANERMSEQLATQQRLIDLVSTLETPTVGIGDDVLLAPLVGHLDSRRAAQITDRLLAAVNARHSRLLILDITGVPVVDTEVAAALLRMVRAVGLLGCRVVLTGVSAAIAVSMTRLGIDLSHIETLRDPQEALNAYMAAPKEARERGLARATRA